MRVIAVKTIRQFWEHYPDAKVGLKSWYEKIGNSTYKTPGDITSSFKGADYVGNTRIVFNIARNKYRLIAAFNYDYQACWIKFVGTHADYDKIDAKTVEFTS